MRWESVDNKSEGKPSQVKGSIVSTNVSTSVAKRFWEILFHVLSHFDEAVAVAGLLRHGDDKYPGIKENHSLRAVERDPIGGHQALVAQGKVATGVGRSTYDDKDETGRRKPGVCSATLVAADLGFLTAPGWAAVLAETLRCDTEGGIRATTMPEIIKLGNMLFGQAGSDFLLRWGIKVVYTLVDQIMTGYGPVINEKGAVALFECSKVARASDTASVAYVRRQLVEADGRIKAGNGSILELDFVLRAMQRNNVARKDVEEMALFCFTQLYDAQVRIRRIVKQIKEGAKFASWYSIHALLGGQSCRLRMLVVKSDDPFAHRAASYLSPDIHLIAQSTGHSQVFTSRRQHLSLRCAVSMLRLLDGDEKIQSQGLDFDVLGQEGELEGVPHWYYQQAAEAVYNRSLTHTDVPKSGTCLQARIDVLCAAFDPRLIREWETKHGFAMRRRSQQNFGCGSDLITAYQNGISAVPWQRS